MKTSTLLLLAASCPAWAGQVCDTSKFPASAPTERFDDNGDGTVTDRTNQLVWMRCSAGQVWSDGTCVSSPEPRDWSSAQAYADEVNRGGAHFFTDWRLPKLPELATIVERECKDPRINLTVFPNTPAEAYWSATPRPSTPGGGPMADEGLVYALDFGAEGVSARPRSERHLVRLVRTGP